MKFLDKATILTASDLPTEKVPVPEWGGTVLVRGLTAAERDAYDMSLVEQREGVQGISLTNMTNMRARLVARCVVDEKGTRLFNDEDVEALGQKSGTPIDRIAEVARRLSGMLPEEKKALEKN